MRIFSLLSAINMLRLFLCCHVHATCLHGVVPGTPKLELQQRSTARTNNMEMAVSNFVRFSNMIYTLLKSCTLLKFCEMRVVIKLMFIRCQTHN